MKIQLKNLGPIKETEFELGDLTIITGANNTGKTYATYATYGFLNYWHDEFTVDVSTAHYQQLLQEGKIVFELENFKQRENHILAGVAFDYSQSISRVLSGREPLFEKTKLKIIELGKKIDLASTEVKRNFGSAENVIEVIKEKGSTKLTISLLVELNSKLIPSYAAIDAIIGRAIRDAIFGSIVPKPFIASAERTGAAIFQKELDFTRNRIVEMLAQGKKKLEPFTILGEFKGQYPIPVRKNVDFIRALATIKNDESFITKEHPELLEQFADIIGGKYQINSVGDVEFIPSKKKVQLSLVESSSCVRSLLDIGFYLRHMVEPGDILIVDEPELNLHPQNQRRVARLFARLVNLGIRIFITTHSDYMIKEFNTLLMLNQDKPHLKDVAKREGYIQEEFLKTDQVFAYLAEEDAKSKSMVLTKAEITQDRGIEINSFDDAIEEMNRIQDAIIWGGDDE